VKPGTAEVAAASSAPCRTSRRCAAVFNIRVRRFLFYFLWTLFMGFRLPLA
jgi:hypothetical protein